VLSPFVARPISLAEPMHVIIGVSKAGRLGIERPVYSSGIIHPESAQNRKGTW